MSFDIVMKRYNTNYLVDQAKSINLSSESSVSDSTIDESIVYFDFKKSDLAKIRAEMPVQVKIKESMKF